MRSGRLKVQRLALLAGLLAGGVGLLDSASFAGEARPAAKTSPKESRKTAGPTNPPTKAPPKPPPKPPPPPPPPPIPAGEGPVMLDLTAEWQAEFRQFTQLIAGRDTQVPEGQVLRRDALILPRDRDPLDVALRRTEALLQDIKRLGAKGDLAAIESDWRGVKAEVARCEPQVQTKTVSVGRELRETTFVANELERQALFQKVCAVRRRIAFANPLLDFDKLLFLRTYRRRPGHICDQFFGPHVAGGPGGGVYVLQDPFGPKPVLKNLLANSTVQSGRLKGTKLEGGSFLSPDVSYDARTLLFAYTECQGQRPAVQYDSRLGIWDIKGAYHIFKVNADGSNLAQLTDGQFNDFDPCWLPNGRIVFISERRGGYGRCHGRPVPTYTLHSMNADGSDIVSLSYHETNEWNPSVTHDGLIVYTRWDYVDRGDCIAHHPWITTPDGRDARAIQGNYPSARTARPDAEHDLRAIPGSRRFVATAAPHHGQSFGSLIMVDPDAEDDGSMAALKRITPDNSFPETQRGRLFYGTAWPLSEDYYLCVYGGLHKDSVYLVDSFGNRELVYCDPVIESLSPMPLRPRLRPPAFPHATAVGRPAAATKPGVEPKKPEMSTVMCMNVYDGLLPWPAGAEIKALRIIQLFPKATPSIDNPRIGAWSESLARGVLGTVPVETDGSAHFLVPAGKTIYFQALDKDGLAVQSMQSDVYTHPGERLACAGCHEPRYRAPAPPARMPLALRRAPSAIQPEMDQANPVSFPRLVQPVLDQRCVACHSKQTTAPNLNGLAQADRAGRRPTWSPAYSSLAKYAFGRSGKPPGRGEVRTVPGQFGAMASKLYQLLKAGHHDVKLSPQEMRRLTLWLDCNSNFYGAYFDLDKQMSAELVKPDLE